MMFIYILYDVYILRNEDPNGKCISLRLIVSRCLRLSPLVRQSISCMCDAVHTSLEQ